MIFARYALIFIATLGLVSCKARQSSPKAANSELQSSDSSSKESTLDDKEYVQWLVTNAKEGQNLDRTCPADCTQVSIYVELPRGPKDSNVGHSAVAIGDVMYDFGPSNVKDGPALSSKDNCEGQITVKCDGSRWWGNRYRQISFGQNYEFLFPNATKHEDITRSDIIENLHMLAGPWPVVEMPLCLRASSAQMLKEWWVKFEKNRPKYEVPGAHCTSTVYASMIYADVFNKSSIRNQTPGYIGTFQGGTMSPTQFSRNLIAKPETVISKKMLCDQAKWPPKAEQIYPKNYQANFSAQ